MTDTRNVHFKSTLIDGKLVGGERGRFADISGLGRPNGHAGFDLSTELKSAGYPVV